LHKLCSTLLPSPLMSQHCRLQTKETTKKEHLAKSRDWPVLKGLSPEILETFNQQ